MRLLADENFPKAIVNQLREAGHDVLWARTNLAGSSDLVLLEIAELESRLVITLDKDFWQIALQRRKPLEQAGVILIRVHPATPEEMAPLVRLFLDAQAPWTGHISKISVDGIQMVAPARRTKA